MYNTGPEGRPQKKRALGLRFLLFRVTRSYNILHLLLYTDPQWRRVGRYAAVNPGGVFFIIFWPASGRRRIGTHPHFNVCLFCLGKLIGQALARISFQSVGTWRKKLFFLLFFQSRVRILSLFGKLSFVLDFSADILQERKVVSSYSRLSTKMVGALIAADMLLSKGKEK